MSAPTPPRLKLFRNLVLIYLAFTGFSGCARDPILPQYRALDSENKKIFIAYYPELSPAQREELFALDGGAYLIHKWELEGALKGGRKAGRLQDYTKNRAHYTLTDLTISSDNPQNPITTGSSLKLAAIVHYQDGRKVEVGDDATWKANPPLVHVKGHRLEYECVASDVEVSADFLDERTGSKVFRFRKPLSSLEIVLDNAYGGQDVGEFLRFKAIAHCNDGTSSEVTCQAEWSTLSAAAEMKGCGNLHLLRPRGSTEIEARVDAFYAGHSASRVFHIPPPRH